MVAVGRDWSTCNTASFTWRVGFKQCLTTPQRPCPPHSILALLHCSLSLVCDYTNPLLTLPV